MHSLRHSGLGKVWRETFQDRRNSKSLKVQKKAEYGWTVCKPELGAGILVSAIVRSYPYFKRTPLTATWRTDLERGKSGSRETVRSCSNSPGRRWRRGGGENS